MTSIADHKRRRTGQRTMSIERALNWAFGRECVQMDFDEMGETAHGNRRGMDGIAVMIERGQVGCSIDGGGRSAPAWDAEIIASAVASLPVGFGGRSMAAQIASLSRAGVRPDWMPDASPRCVPVGWRTTKHGHFAQTEVVGEVVTVHRGRKIRREIVACPVRYTPTAQQIASARRHYLDWWGALLWIGAELRTLHILDQIEITQDMPPMTPWIARG